MSSEIGFYKEFNNRKMAESNESQQHTSY